MDVGAAVVTDEQPLELVQPGEGALDDPAVTAEPGPVCGLAACDLGADAAPTELSAMARIVVAAVGSQPLRPPSRPAALAAAPLALGQRAGSAG